MPALPWASLVFLAATSASFAAPIAPENRELFAIGVGSPCLEQQTGPLAPRTMPPRPANDDRQYCVESGRQVKVVVDRPGKDVLLLLGGRTGGPVGRPNLAQYADFANFQIR
jgi:hypothetical protein